MWVENLPGFSPPNDGNIAGKFGSCATMELFRSYNISTTCNFGQVHSGVVPQLVGKSKLK